MHDYNTAYFAPFTDDDSMYGYPGTDRWYLYCSDL